jgi:thymidylate kinase
VIEEKCFLCKEQCKYLSLRRNLEDEYGSVINNSKIIAIEGIVGAGKTTLIECMKQNGVVDKIIPEYTVLAKRDDIPEFTQNEEKLKLSTCFYAGIELRRQKMILDSVKNNDRVILLDRSELSILSFNYAAEKRYYIKDLCTPTFNCLKNVTIIEPSAYIYLDISYQTSLDRMKKRGSFKESVFTDEDFVKSIIAGYRCFLENSNFIEINGNLPITITSRELLKII